MPPTSQPRARVSPQVATDVTTGAPVSAFGPEWRRYTFCMSSSSVIARPVVGNPAAHRAGLVLLLGAALWLGLSGPAQAQWRWKDKAGQMHASDQPPPPDILDKDILQRPRNAPAPLPFPSSGGSAAAAPVAAPASGPPSKLETEVEARRQKAEQDERAKKKAAEDANAATRAENCSRARQSIANYESGQRVARVNAQGEREILDDKARAEELQRARALASSECK